MSTVFEGYEHQYTELSTSISQKCLLAANSDGENKQKKVAEIMSDLQDADSLIRKMDLEARSLQPSVRAGVLIKLKEYKSNLNKLKADLKKVMEANTQPTTRDELMEAGGVSAFEVASDDKGRLLMSTERLNQSTERLKESRRTLLETEDLGVSILQDLHQQRQSLLHAHSALHGVDDSISKSKKILSAMSKRIDRNKMIIGGLIVALVLAIIIILYSKFAH